MSMFQTSEAGSFSVPASIPDMNGASVKERAQKLGEFPLPHIMTFSGISSILGKVYRNPDQAIRNSRRDADVMRNNLLVMECLEARQRAVALLPWSLTSSKPKDPLHQAAVRILTEIIEATPLFTEFRRCLQEAIWRGREGMQMRFGRHMVDGQEYAAIVKENDDDESLPWEPVNGDKLAFGWGERRGEVGIRVGYGSFGETGLDRGNIEVVAEYGPVRWLTPDQKPHFLVHKHMIEDGAFEDNLSAGAIHGVGIRSRIYWTWFQMQAVQQLLLEFIERSALGFDIWTYPWGNAQAEAKMRAAANERVGSNRNIILVPVMDGQEDLFRYDHIEPGLQGAEMLNTVVHQHFGWGIKRYILGQILSTEPEGSGLGGSGLSDLHKDSLMGVIRYDASNHGETLTRLVRRLIRLNRSLLPPGAEHMGIKFVVNTEADDIKEALEALEKAWNMNLPIPTDHMYTVTGVPKPTQGEETLPGPAGGEQGQGEPGQPGGDGASLFDHLAEQINGQREEVKANHEETKARFAAIEERQKRLFPDREFSSTQFDLVGNLRQSVLDLGKSIPDEVLSGKGRENDPHITVLYGLHDEDLEGVQSLVDSFGPVDVKLGKTSVFECPDYDVVMVNVDSPQLRALNSKLTDLPHTTTHAYTPHVTLAYVKPGEGKKFSGISDLEGEGYVFATLQLSGASGKKSEIPLSDSASVASRYGERWITINGNSGDDEDGGTRVKIDDDGNIVAGPDGLASKGIKKLSDFGGKKKKASKPKKKAAKKVAEKPEPKSFRTIAPRARVNIDQMADLMEERGYSIGKPETDLKAGHTRYPVTRDGQTEMIPAKEIQKFLTTDDADIFAFEGPAAKSTPKKTPAKKSPETKKSPKKSLKKKAATKPKPAEPNGNFIPDKEPNGNFIPDPEPADRPRTSAAERIPELFRRVAEREGKKALKPDQKPTWLDRVIDLVAPKVIGDKPGPLVDALRKLTTSTQFAADDAKARYSLGMSALETVRRYGLDGMGQDDRETAGLALFDAANALARYAADWDESKHPRGGDGKFGSGGTHAPDLSDEDLENLSDSDDVIFDAGGPTIPWSVNELDTFADDVSVAQLEGEIDSAWQDHLSDNPELLRDKVKQAVSDIPFGFRKRIGDYVGEWLADNEMTEDDLQDADTRAQILDDLIDMGEDHPVVEKARAELMGDTRKQAREILKQGKTLAKRYDKAKLEKAAKDAGFESAKQARKELSKLQSDFDTDTGETELTTDTPNPDEWELTAIVGAMKELSTDRFDRDMNVTRKSLRSEIAKAKTFDDLRAIAEEHYTAKVYTGSRGADGGWESKQVGWTQHRDREAQLAREMIEADPDNAEESDRGHQFIETKYGGIDGARKAVHKLVTSLAKMDETQEERIMGY